MTDLQRWPRIIRTVLAVEGVALVVFAVAGLAVTGLADPTGTPDTYLLGFRINALQCGVWLVTGLLALVGAARPRFGKRFAAVQGVFFTIFFLYTASNAIGSGSPTFLNLNTASVVLGPVLAVVGFGVAALPLPGPRRSAASAART